MSISFSKDLILFYLRGFTFLTWRRLIDNNISITKNIKRTECIFATKDLNDVKDKRYFSIYTILNEKG